MIQLEGVGKKFGASWVFRGADLSVRAGSSAVIVGLSGSGKSVLLKLIAGLLVPDEGRLQVASPRVSMLFQRNALFDSMTVLENLLFPLREGLNIEGPEAIEQARLHLDWVGLTGTGHLLPGELSGGMQKRLGIARALIVRPEVVLYDDPTAGLDPITSRKICSLIRRLQQERMDGPMTFIAVTHEMNRAYELGDEIHLLARGRLWSGGSPDQVRRSQDPAIRQFVHGLQEGPLS